MGTCKACQNQWKSRRNWAYIPLYQLRLIEFTYWLASNSGDLRKFCFLLSSNNTHLPLDCRIQWTSSIRIISKPFKNSLNRCVALANRQLKAAENSFNNDNGPFVESNIGWHGHIKSIPAHGKMHICIWFRLGCINWNTIRAENTPFRIMSSKSNGNFRIEHIKAQKFPSILGLAVKEKLNFPACCVLVSNKKSYVTSEICTTTRHKKK